MSLSPRAGQIILLIAYCCVPSFATGGETTASQPLEIDKWVQQLGDDSYEVRENASRRLSALGLAAKPGLLAGLRGTDPEIRWRCVELWAAIYDIDFDLRAEKFLKDPEGDDNYEFPGWERYRRIFGVSREARQTFLSLQRAEPVLWEEFGNVTTEPPPRFRLRCRQLRNALKDKQGQTKIEGAAAMTVLLMSVNYESMGATEDSRWMDELWNVAEVMDTVRSDSTWRSFKSEWFRRTDDPRPAFERLIAGLGNGGDDLVLIARELLRNKATPTNQKQFSLLALAKSHMPEDDVLIQKFLDDESMIDTYFSRGVVLKSQLRDVALATLIVRAGENPAEFGFKYLREDDRTLLAPSTLGFQDDNERRAAFEKWLSRATQRDNGETR